MKILTLVLGSAWFLPVSCTAGLVAGTHAISRWDERYVANGDQLHPFTVIVQPGEADESIRAIDLAEARNLQMMMEYLRSTNESGRRTGASSELERTAEGSSFYLSRPSGSIDVDWAEISYRVIEDTGREQFIDVLVSANDGDGKVWSRYRSTQSTVVPISSRMLYFGHMFGAMPFAVVASLLLLACGRRFRRKLGRPLGSDEPS